MIIYGLYMILGLRVPIRGPAGVYHQQAVKQK